MASKSGKREPSKWGKGKTDPATWWKKGGKSPNPAGRPKGSKSQKTLYQEAFEKKITVKIDGEEIEAAKGAVGYHQLANKSASGDLKAIAMQLGLDEKFAPADLPPPTAEEAALDFETFSSWLELREKFEVFAKKKEGGDD